MVTSIEASFQAEEYALGCFIDIAGAFNYITFIAIIRACHKFGIDVGITAPTAALEVLLNLPLLHILIENESLSVLSRLTRNQSLKMINAGHSEAWFRSKSILPVLHLKTDYVTPTYKFSRKFDLSILDRTIWINNQLSSQADINLYTDGSLMNDMAGAGI